MLINSSDVEKAMKEIKEQLEDKVKYQEDVSLNFTIYLIKLKSLLIDKENR